MSKGLSYYFCGTMGDLMDAISSLPESGQELLEMGWEEISHPQQAKMGSHTYKNQNNGLKIRYDEPKTGTPGFRGMGHYHIFNPDATGNDDLYLDINGNPVRKGSRASHIIPKGDKI